MSNIFLAVIDEDTEMTYAAFSDEETAIDYLHKYMKDNLEFHLDEEDYPEELDHTEWQDITDFQGSLSVIKLKLDPKF